MLSQFKPEEVYNAILHEMTPFMDEEGKIPSKNVKHLFQPEIPFANNKIDAIKRLRNFLYEKYKYNMGLAETQWSVEHIQGFLAYVRNFGLPLEQDNLPKVIANWAAGDFGIPNPNVPHSTTNEGITDGEFAKIEKVLTPFGKKFWANFILAQGNKTPFVNVYNVKDKTILFSIHKVEDAYEMDIQYTKTKGHISKFGDVLVWIKDKLKEISNSLEEPTVSSTSEFDDLPEVKLPKLLEKYGFKFKSTGDVTAPDNTKKKATIYDNDKHERIFLFHDGKSRFWPQLADGKQVHKDFNNVQELVAFLETVYKVPGSEKPDSEPYTLPQMDELLSYYGFSKKSDDGQNFIWQREHPLPEEVVVHAWGASKFSPAGLSAKDAPAPLPFYFKTFEELGKYIDDKYGKNWPLEYLFDALKGMGMGMQVKDDDNNPLGYRYVSYGFEVIPYPNGGGIIQTLIPWGSMSKVNLEISYHSTYDIAKKLDDLSQKADNDWTTGNEVLDDIIVDRGFTLNGNEKGQLVFVKDDGTTLTYNIVDHSSTITFPPENGKESSVSFTSDEELQDHFENTWTDPVAKPTGKTEMSEFDDLGPCHPKHHMSDAFHKSGFHPEMNSYGVLWEHKNGVTIQFFKKGVRYKTEEGTKERLIAEHDQDDVIKKFCEKISPTTSNAETDQYISQSFLTPVDILHEKIWEELWNMGEALHGEAKYAIEGTQLMKNLFKNGFAYYSHEKMWVNEDLRQIVIVHPEGGHKHEVKFGYMGTTMPLWGIGLDDSDTMFQWIGPNGKIAKKSAENKHKDDVSFKEKDGDYFTDSPAEWKKYQPYKAVPNPTSVKGEAWERNELKTHGFDWIDSGKIYVQVNTKLSNSKVDWEAVRFDSDGSMIYFYAKLDKMRRFFMTKNFNNLMKKIEEVHDSMFFSVGLEPSVSGFQGAIDFVNKLTDLGFSCEPSPKTIYKRKIQHSISKTLEQWVTISPDTQTAKFSLVDNISGNALGFTEPFTVTYGLQMLNENPDNFAIRLVPELESKITENGFEYKPEAIKYLYENAMGGQIWMMFWGNGTVDVSSINSNGEHSQHMQINSIFNAVMWSGNKDFNQKFPSSSTPSKPSMPFSEFDYSHWADNTGHNPNGTIQLMEKDTKTLAKLGWSLIESSKHDYYYKNMAGQKAYFFVNGKARLVSGDEETNYDTVKELMESLWNVNKAGNKEESPSLLNVDEHQKEIIHKLKELGFEFFGDADGMAKYVNNTTEPGDYLTVVWDLNKHTMKYTHTSSDPLKQTNGNPIIETWINAEDDAMTVLNNLFGGKQGGKPSIGKSVELSSDNEHKLGFVVAKNPAGMTYYGKKNVTVVFWENGSAWVTVKNKSGVHKLTKFNTYPVAISFAKKEVADNEKSKKVLAGTEDMPWSGTDYKKFWDHLTADQFGLLESYDEKTIQSMGWHIIPFSDVNDQKTDPMKGYAYSDGNQIMAFDKNGKAYYWSSYTSGVTQMWLTVEEALRWLWKNNKPSTTPNTNEVPYSYAGYTATYENAPPTLAIPLVSKDEETMKQMGFKKLEDPAAGNSYKVSYKRTNGDDNVYFYANGGGAYWASLTDGPHHFDTIHKLMQFLWDKYNPNIQEGSLKDYLRKWLL